MQKIIVIAAIILLPVIVLLASTGFLVYNEGFYAKLLSKEHADISEPLILSVQLIDYFKASGFTAPVIEGLTVSEQSHLIDVKKVIRGVFCLLSALTVLFVLLLAFSDYKRKVFFYGGLFSIALPVLIAAIPFENAFVLFHNAFFANGTWLFPEGALLVSAFTQGFFQGFAVMILLQCAVSGVILLVLSSRLLTKKNVL